ncbi:MAG: DUF2283 domain-containing protein [Thermofilum sp.]|jgi:uncharacterized protein YuzE|nr:DUF2283 domain-containing protein [Thermofilum sp.]
MKIRYDREGDVLDILVRDAQIHHAEDYGQVIINYDEESRVVEIEILEASRVLKDILEEIIKAPKREIVEIA